MRRLSGIALVFCFGALVLNVGANAQTAPPGSATQQTPRQALIEMFFGQGADHLEKHLPQATRKALQSLSGDNGQNFLGEFSLLAAQAKAGKEKLETFDTGSTLLSMTGTVGGTYDKFEVSVERDDLSGDEDQIEVGFHAMRGGKEQTLPFVSTLTFTMKMETGIWRLNEIGLGVRLPLGDPAFLKSLVERERGQNEQAALWSVRSVVSAETSYQSANGAFACSLSALGSGGKTPGKGRSYLYDTQLISGKKSGYVFAISNCDSSHYQLAAEPAVAGSGQRAYCADESGAVRSAADGKAATCLTSGTVVETPASATLQMQLAASPDISLVKPVGGAAAAGAPQGSAGPQRVRVSQGVMQALSIQKTPPVYPPDARAARIQGTVVLQVIISKTGDVENVSLISGHPLLAQAAIDAVRQWKYKPYLLNGNPVEVETQATVNFTLAGD